MPNYYLKTPDSTKMYRVVYTPDDSTPPNITLNGCYITGVGVRTPDGRIRTAFDEVVSVDAPFVDLALGNVAEAAGEDYRAAAKSFIDAQW